MKKLSKLGVLFVLMVFLLSMTNVSCAEQTIIASRDYAYKVQDDGTVCIIFYSGSGETLSIPAEIDGRAVTGITRNRFSVYGSKTWIEIPDSVQFMEENPFAGCENLLSIVVSPDHPYFATIDGVLFEKKTKTLICYPLGKQGESYTVPDGIKAIGDYAFCRCSSLTNIELPNSVTTIGKYAFDWCSSLTSINIPDSVTTIGNMAFYGCDSLTSVEIPSSVTTIGNMAFDSCKKLTAKVSPNSYAATYCKENNIPFTYIEDTSWLTD